MSNAAHDVGYTAVLDGDQTAGAIVWWRLSGGLDLETLEAAWRAEGLEEDLLPASPSPLAALRRAVNELRAPARLIRPIKDQAGFAVLDEYQTGGDFDYKKRLAVRVTDLGSLRWDYVREQEEADLVAAAFNKNLITLTQGDASNWLSSLMEDVRAVALRDTGGIYFVPRFSSSRWERMLCAVRSASKHVVSCVPALKTEEAQTAFLDALSQEAERHVEAMQRELGDNSLGKRALESRITRTEDVEAKLSAYEGLLGGKLDTLRDRINSLRAQLTSAVLTVTPQDGPSAQLGLQL